MRETPTMKRTLVQVITLLVMLGTSSHVEASQSLLPYYGSKLQLLINAPQTGPQIKQELHRILTESHIPQERDADVIQPKCPKNSKASKCYRHIELSYTSARRILMGKIHLRPMGKGNWAIDCVYCNRTFDRRDFPKGPAPAPNQIPDHNVINVEHTWPQSRFSKKFPSSLQKSDLHILYPVSRDANSLRSNHPFGDLKSVFSQACPLSALGMTLNKRRAFEPPKIHRGNTARALFYFSIRYQLPIDPAQESILRQWHINDPVDADEKDRVNLIFAAQRNRNPFVDHPELVDEILDF